MRLVLQIIIRNKTGKDLLKWNPFSIHIHLSQYHKEMCYLEYYAPKGVDVAKGRYLTFVGDEAEKLRGSPA